MGCLRDWIDAWFGADLQRSLDFTTTAIENSSSEDFRGTQVYTMK
jgi:hypothetical protein